MVNLKNVLESNIINTNGVVYKITNLVTGKVYIGKTINSFRVRYFGKLGNCKVFRTHNDELQMDLYEYGLSNFKVELLVENILDEDLLAEIEKIAIDEYKKYFHMYNKVYNNINRENAKLIKRSIIKDFLDLDIPHNYKSRFMYMCTFMDCENNLVVGKTSDRRKIKDSELKDILRLGKTETARTKKYLLENNLISIENNFIKVNLPLNYRDLVDSKDFIRNVYEQLPISRTKKLSQLLYVLNYYHYDFKVLCENPIETDEENIRKISFSSIFKRMGKSKSQTSRLKSDLLNIKIENVA
ncbi:hypothetical protein P7A62_00605 [Clostridium perfringens]|nr:hypothetical protein [Clostridium perfringens]